MGDIHYLTPLDQHMHGQVKPKSKYRGVFWSRQHHRWVVVLYMRDKKLTLTHVFQDEEKAALAFDALVKCNHAPLHLLNFPDKPELKLVK